MRTIQVPDTVRLRSQDRAASFQRALDLPRPQQYAPGQLWSTHSMLSLSPEHLFETDIPRVIVILEAFEPAPGEWPYVMAAPITLDVHMASDLDVILTPDLNTLGIDCLVEVWNEAPVLAAHLKQFLGTITYEVLQVILSVSQACAFGEMLAPELTGWIGPRLFGPSDPRYEFQRNEVKAVAYLTQAATVAIELPLPNLVPNPAPTPRNQLVFSLQPVYDLLSRYIPSQPLMVAHAASEVEDARMLVHQPGRESGFTFELWHQKRPPYRVNAHVYALTEDLVERSCVIEILTSTGVLRSPSTTLSMDLDITIDEQIHFRLADIEEVTITIE